MIQDVSGSATPINPNTAGNFATDQASLLITTTLTSVGGTSVTNTVGPNYAITNTAVWSYNRPMTAYTDTLPVVRNNGGSVVLQGFVIDR